MQKENPERLDEKGNQYFFLKGQNAEKAVQNLAERTFLTDWCYPNPKLPNGKELCDLLVVFDSMAIIWEIKDLKLGKNGKYKKSEVEENLRHLAGARRQLFDLRTPIELKNPRRGKELFDPSQITETYLVSVLVGEDEEEYCRIYEEIKNRPAHVFNRTFTQIILRELDSISDFCEYLRKKEALMATDRKLFISGGEEELLAFYLKNAHSFETIQEANVAFFDGTLWEHLQNLPEYKAKKKADEISYVWDSIIDRAHEGSSQYEIIARELARTNRFERRCLSKAFYEAQLRAHKDETHNLYRRYVAGEEVTYCFLFMDEPEPRHKRIRDLKAMVILARGLFPNNKKVVGIATGKKMRSECSYDFWFLEKPNWTDDDRKILEDVREKFAILKNPVLVKYNEEEYPTSDKS